jgi:hypothetical protein
MSSQKIDVSCFVMLKLSGLQAKTRLRSGQAGASVTSFIDFISAAGTSPVKQSIVRVMASFLFYKSVF